MPKRDQPRRPARRSPYKDPKPRILIVTEGEVTEPEYFRGFIGHHRNPLVCVEVVGGKGNPRKIVEYARRRKQAAAEKAEREQDDNLLNDQVWCVFDVDQHTLIAESKDIARANGLELAISNPCFELWLLLHFVDPPGECSSSQLERKLKKHVNTYNKSIDFKSYASGLLDAERRASKLDNFATAANEEGRNPTTGVWRLTRCVRNHSP